MTKFIALLTIVLLAACTTDVVTSHYATLAEAREDELFGRGWLPDVLPPSAVNIRTTNNLDINVSDGEFSFRPEEAPMLFLQLRAGVPASVASEGRAERIAAQARRVDSTWTFEAEQTTWVFFCRAAKGHCRYTMWMTRPTPSPGE